MTTRLHHVHASVVHAPLTLIPAAALVDLRAASTRSGRQARLGRTLWWYAAASAAVAGVAGMAASQEVKARARSSKAMMWLHGTSNVALLLGTIGMAAWRQRNRPTLRQSTIGLGGIALMGYSAWLGGMLVYEHGAGVAAMPERADQGVGESANVLSPKAPLAFLRDAARGAWWLLTGSRAILREGRSLGRAATGKAPEPGAPSVHEPVQSYEWPS